MAPKPPHLGPRYAAQFRDRSVVAAYRHRPPYPTATFGLLLSLLPPGAPRAILDPGTGSGELARNIVWAVDRVDAVDPSRGMIERGKGLPGGDHPRLRWIEGRAEDAPLWPPYGLVTAGASLRWTEWETVLPRVDRVLVPTGSLAIVEDTMLPVPWRRPLGVALRRFSTNREYRPYDLVEELTARRLSARAGGAATEPVPFRQSIGDHVESFHARNGFSRDRMSAADAEGFDDAVRRAVAPYAEGGVVAFQVLDQVRWGRPVSTGG